jgi:hypothetical protein
VGSTKEMAEDINNCNQESSRLSPPTLPPFYEQRLRLSKLQVSKKIIRGHSHWNRLLQNGTTPLHEYASSGNDIQVAHLISEGFDINRQDRVCHSLLLPSDLIVAWSHCTPSCL